jgi:hypothetical protein
VRSGVERTDKKIQMLICQTIIVFLEDLHIPFGCNLSKVADIDCPGGEKNSSQGLENC